MAGNQRFHGGLKKFRPACDGTWCQLNIAWGDAACIGPAEELSTRLQRG